MPSPDSSPLVFPFQAVLYSGSRVCLPKLKSDHITSLLTVLQWLLIVFRTNVTILSKRPFLIWPCLLFWHLSCRFLNFLPQHSWVTGSCHQLHSFQASVAHSLFPLPGMPSSSHSTGSSSWSFKIELKHHSLLCLWNLIFSLGLILTSACLFKISFYLFIFNCWLLSVFIALCGLL